MVADVEAKLQNLPFTNWSAPTPRDVFKQNKTTTYHTVNIIIDLFKETFDNRIVLCFAL